MLAQLKAAELERQVGPGHVHADVADAVRHATNRILRARHKAAGQSSTASLPQGDGTGIV